MNINKTPRSSAHEDVWTLLPWYANGTLRAEERTRVEGHLRDCILCRRELAMERRTLEAFHAEVEVPHAARDGFERLRERIRQQAPAPRRTPMPDTGLLQRLLGWLGDSQPRVVWWTALAAVPVLALVLVLPLARAPDGTPDPYRDGFHTLSNTVGDAAPGDEINLVFAPGTGAGTIEDLLGSTGAEIVGGPNSAGAYRVRVVSGEASGGGLTTALERLRGRPEVVFAEAAQPMAAPAPEKNRP